MNPEHTDMAPIIAVDASSEAANFILGVNAASIGEHAERMRAILQALGTPPFPHESQCPLASISLSEWPLWQFARDTNVLSLPPSISGTLDRTLRAHEKATGVIEPHRVALSRKLRQEGIEEVYFKGRELNLFLKLPWNRRSGDTDILVRQDQLDGAEDVLRTLGYQQGLTTGEGLGKKRIFSQRGGGALNLTPLPEGHATKVRQYHHQVFPFYKVIETDLLQDYRDVFEAYPWASTDDRKTYLIHIVDLHFNIANGVDEDDFSYHQRPTRFTSDGQETEISFLAPEILLCFFCGRSYYENIALNKAGAKDFRDMLAVLYNYHSSLDWDWVTYFGSKYRQQAALYYSLNRCEQLFPGVVPVEVFGFVERFLSANRQFDLGDALPRMFNTLPFSPLMTSYERAVRKSAESQ